ncbi:MAG: SdrD B-like domain-containing protein [Pirellulales bacterium]
MKRQHGSLWDRIRQRLTRNPARRSRLRIERLENRSLLAVTVVPPAITGRVFVDMDGDTTFDSGEQVQGATVQLFADDGDQAFDAGDTQVGSNVLTDVDGEYGFSSLDANLQYFVRQTAQTVNGQTLPERVSSLLTPAATGLTIDTFVGPQIAQATSGDPSGSSSLATSEAVGGERDLSVTMNTGVAMNLLVDQPGAAGVLSFDATSGAQGTYRVTWDGTDNDPDQLAFGLNNLDLTQGGVNTGLLLRAGVDGNGGSVTIRFYANNAATVSQATVQIPQTQGGLPTGTVYVPFSSFSNPAGVPPSQVDAIQLEIGDTDPVDGQISLIGALAPVIQNFVNEGEVDLVIAKFSAAGNLTPGQTITYNINVQNTGASVNDVVIADLVPAQLENVQWTSTPSGGATGNSASGSGDINETVNLPTGSSIVYVVTAKVKSDATGSVSNTATVTPPEGITDANPENNSSTQTNNIVQTVDLFVTKTDGVTSVAPGQSVTYTIVVGNNGPATATGAVFSDNFPSILTNVSYTSTAAGGATGNTLTGSGNLSETLTIPTGGSVTYTVTGTVVPDAHLTTATLVNPATVTAPQGTTDSNNANNTATDTDTLTPTADLSITKTDSVTQVAPGGTLTYQIVVSNAGPSTVAGATVVDQFPGNLTNVTFTSQASGGATGNTASGAGNLNETVTLPPSSTVTYTVSATVAAGATGTVSNTATVTAPETVTEINAENNSATDIDQIGLPPDLVLTKSNTSSQIPPGGAIQYTIVVSNTGGTGVTGARITDTFPAALTGVSFTSTASGGATGNNATGSGNLDETVNLPAGSSITYEVTATVSNSATGTITNTATVTPPQGVVESNTDNNTDSETDNVSISADLSVTKTNSLTSVNPGQAVTYTIVVANAGPGNVTGATFADTFPAAFTNATFTSTAAGGATGNTASGSGNLNQVLNLPSGSSVTYIVAGTVAANATGTLANTATVTPPNTVVDSVTTNNSATDSDPINSTIDLGITKTNNVTQVTAGGTVQYTITVTNLSSTTVTGATVVDNFPSTLTNVSYTTSATGGATGNTAGTGNINQTLTMPAGATVSYQVTATVSGTTTGSVANTATVAAPNGITDSNTANNSATETDTVVLSGDLSVTKTNNVTTVTPGQTVTYTIVAANAGPSTITGATLTDSFPTTLTNVTFTSVASGGASGNTASGSGNLSQTLTLPGGSSVTYTVTGTVSPTISTTSLANTVTISAPAGVTDSNTANNSATDTDTVVYTPGSIEGLVYYDNNGDGEYTAGTDTGISGVTLTLVGTALNGQSVSTTAVTDSSGNYEFPTVLPGSYTLTETQPSYFFDGPENVGSGQNSNTQIRLTSNNDQFFIQLANGDTATGLDFSENGLAFSKRQFLASTSSS